MNKKVDIIIIIAAIIVALIVGLFNMTADELKQDKNWIMTIGNDEYMIDDFRKFIYIKNEMDGDISKVLEDEEMDTMIQDYLEAKIYAKAADKKGISVPEENLEEYKMTYQGKAETLSAYNISEDDYVEYSVDDYKHTELSNNFGNYFELSDEVYNEALEGISGDKKSYAYRIMAFKYEEESGDEAESGDETTSGDEEEEDKSRETVLATAQMVLDKVRSGDDFETLAKEHGTYRFTFKGAEYTLVNGEIEYATAPVLESKVNNTDLYNAILALNSGDTTDLVEDTENKYIYFSKLESLEEGFVGEAEIELKSILLNELQDSLVTTGITFQVNQSALIRAYYKQ